MSGFLFRSTHLVVSRSWLKGRGPNSPPSLRKSGLKFCQLRQKLKSLAKQTKRAWPSTSFGCSGTLREGSRAVPVVTDGPFPKFLCCKIKFWFWGNTGIILEQIPVFSNVGYRYFFVRGDRHAQEAAGFCTSNWRHHFLREKGFLWLSGWAMWP